MDKDIAASDLILNADTLIKIIDKLPHVVYLKDSQHRFLLANKACLTMLNAEAEDVLGETDQSFYVNSYVEYVHEIEKNILRNGEKKIVPEERFLDPNGNQQIMKTIRLPFYIPEMNEIGVLGIAVNMAKEKEMEESIRSQNETLQIQKAEIDNRRKTAEDLYNKVKTGLKVSKFIQEAILPNESSVKRYLPDSFVLYKPKELTNGDFYWVQAKDGYIYIATIDCTEFDAGGTFLAMLCYDLLSQILKQKFKPSPSDILYELNDGLKDNLEQCVDLSRMTERLHINICVVDKENLYIEQSGSGTPMIVVNKYSNQVLEPQTEKIGLPFDEDEVKFIDNRIRVKKGDIFYMMTDGISQQQTSLRRDKEKFGYGRLKDLLLEISDYTMDKQAQLLKEIVDEFTGDEPQSDDMIVIGVKM
ncbi:MAG TPA: SpoIIE family protein phosphatase [Cytophagaceae bacterium]|jgi:PAS domain S-box-containing protein|nr:SpoIIE family protein phosphatase [Cytophagaceae bacterium]